MFEEEERTRTPMHPPKLQEMQPRTKKIIMVDEHGTPCGSLRKDFERDVRLLTKDLDPGPCFKDQEDAMQQRYFKRLFEGKFL